MKLYYSATSPYARKVRVCVREKGLIGRIEESLCNPWADPASLRAVNPLGKVPALVLDDGTNVYDSRTICATLEDLQPEPRLIPAAAEARTHVLCAQALGDGVVDTAVGLVLEGRRPEIQQSPEMMNRWRETIGRAVAAMEPLLAKLGDEPTLGHIALGVALSYLDFRQPSILWRNANPDLAAWHHSFSARPSFIETAPPPGA
jgi:glutathione S-transferase